MDEHEIIPLEIPHYSTASTRVENTQEQSPGLDHELRVSSRPESLIFENRIKREWLSTEEAAHFLSITENALRIMVHRGQVPVFKFGRRLRFRHEDCRALFTSKGV